MVSFHVLYFWQRGIRKLELERTKFGKFASQGTNNSRSWKFKFERVLGRKIYLHGRHIFFFFFFRHHTFEHPLFWNFRFSILFFETRNAPFCKPRCSVPRRSASKIPLYIRDGIDICRGEISMQATRSIEGSVIRRLCSSPLSKTFSTLVV